MDDLARFCCQKPDCPTYGRRNAGNLSVCASYGKHDRIRLLYCKACKYRFSERKGTPLFHTHLPEEKARSVLQHLSEGCGVPQTGRLVDVHPNSVVRLAKKAGQHARDAQDELVAFSPSDPRGPVRRDVVVRGQEAKEWRSPQPGRRPQGGLVGPRRYDPQHKLVLALVPRARVTESVEEVVGEVKDRDRDGVQPAGRCAAGDGRTGSPSAVAPAVS